MPPASKLTPLQVVSWKTVGSDDQPLSSIQHFLGSESGSNGDGIDDVVLLLHDDLRNEFDKRSADLGLSPKTNFAEYPVLVISSPNRIVAELPKNSRVLKTNPRYDRFTAGPRVPHNRRLDDFVKTLNGILPTRKKMDIVEVRRNTEDQIDFLKRKKESRKRSHGKGKGKGKFKRKYKTKKNKRKYKIKKNKKVTTIIKRNKNNNKSKDTLKKIKKIKNKNKK